MKVTLLGHTTITKEAAEILEKQDVPTHAEHLITLAGRACYDSFHRPNPKTYHDRDYIKSTVVDKHHWSIAEHATATFLVEGVSRNLTHELVRHRQLSFSQRSQRFCNESNRRLVVPPSLSANGEPDTLQLSDEVTRMYCSTVKQLMDGGYSRKQAREAARAILPGGIETTIVVTGNHRAWREVLNKRLSPAADAEIRRLAVELLRQLSGLAPSIYADLNDNEH